MTPKRRDSVDEASFEGLVDLGSIPPPTSGPSPVDVHAARTAVAELPQGLLEELRRPKQPADPQMTVERRKFDLPADAFGEEPPTAPGKEQRNTDLLAAVNAALAAAGAAKLEAITKPPPADVQITEMPARTTPEPVIPTPPPTPAFAFPPLETTAPRTKGRGRALLLALLAVLVTLAAVFAARRFVHRR